MTLVARDREFIGDLCLALAHRWEPERLFVIFTAYFDEAASHGKNPRLTMAAILGNAYEWRRFETRLGRLQEKYGFTVFHAKDFKAHRGEFRGWPPEAYRGLIHDLTDLVRLTLTEAVTMTLPREQYLSEYRSQPFPHGMPVASQYGLCFSACLAHIIAVILNRGGKEHTLHIVIEDGHANVGDCQRIFNEVKKDLLDYGYHLLGTITLAKKTEARPLMVADFLAHSHYLFDAASEAGIAPSYDEMTIKVPIPAKDAGFTMMKFTPGALAGQKERWESAKKQKVDAWRAARDARRDASGRKPS